MRYTSWGLIVIGLSSPVSWPGRPQDKPAATDAGQAGNMDVLRDEMRADKRAVVASVLQLTEGEANAFWPVYNTYQSDAISRDDRLLALVNTREVW